MIRVVHPGSRIRMLTFYPSRIPDPGVKKAPNPGSGPATLASYLTAVLSLGCSLMKDNFCIYLFLGQDGGRQAGSKGELQGAAPELQVWLFFVTCSRAPFIYPFLSENIFKRSLCFLMVSKFCEVAQKRRISIIRLRKYIRKKKNLQRFVKTTRFFKLREIDPLQK